MVVLVLIAITISTLVLLLLVIRVCVGLFLATPRMIRAAMAFPDLTSPDSVHEVFWSMESKAIRGLTESAIELVEEHYCTANSVVELASRSSERD